MSENEPPDTTSPVQIRTGTLRSALRSGDPVAIDTAIDDLLAHATGQAIDTLMEGLDWTEGDPQSFGHLVPNGFFLGAARSRAWAERAILRLMAKAPETAVRTREFARGVHSIHLEGPRWLDLNTLTALPNLERLRISSSRSTKSPRTGRLHTTGMKTIGTLTHLRCLELEDLDIIQLGDLPLDHLPKLHTLRVIGCPIRNVDGARWLTGLEVLEIGVHAERESHDLEIVPLEDVAAVEGLPMLRHLRLHGVGIRDLPELPHLETLVLTRLPKMEELRIRNYAHLRRVEIRSEVLAEIELEDAPALEHIRVESRALKHCRCLNLNRLVHLALGDFGPHPHPVMSGFEVEGLDSLEQLILSGVRMKRLVLPTLSSLKRVNIRAPARGKRATTDLNLECCTAIEDLELEGRIGALKLHDGLPLIHFRLEGSLDGDLLLSEFPELQRVQIRGPRDATGPERVRLTDLPELREIQLGGGGTTHFVLDRLPALERLVLGAPNQPAVRLGDIRFESRSDALRFLLIHAPELEAPDVRPDLPNLKILDLSGCSSIRNLAWTSQMDRLQAIHARGCEMLEDVRSILPFGELTHLDLRGCDLLRPRPKPALMQTRDEIVEYKTRLVRTKTTAAARKKPRSLHTLRKALARALDRGDRENTVNAIDGLRKIREPEALAPLLEGLSLNALSDAPTLFEGSSDPFHDDPSSSTLALWREEPITGDSDSKQRLYVEANPCFDGPPDTRALRTWALVRILSMAPRSLEEAREFRESITDIHLTGCPDAHLPRMGSFTRLGRLSLGPLPGQPSSEDAIDDLSPLDSLTELGELRLRGLHALRSLGGLENLPLQSLLVTDCPAIEGLGSLAWQERLLRLVIERSSDQSPEYAHLTDLRPLAELGTLNSLVLDGLSNLRDLSPLSSLTRLSELRIRGSNRLSDLRPLSSSKNLEELSLSRLAGLESLRGLSELPRLRTLSLTHCHGIHGTSELRDLPALRTLDLRGCIELEKLDLGPLPALEELRLIGCDRIPEVFSLAAVPRLRHLALSPRPDHCMDGIGSCFHLESLVLEGAGIENLDFLEDLECLESLTLSLDTIGDSEGLKHAPNLRTVMIDPAHTATVRALIGNRPEIEVRERPKTDH